MIHYLFISASFLFLMVFSDGNAFEKEPDFRGKIIYDCQHKRERTTITLHFNEGKVSPKMDDLPILSTFFSNNHSPDQPSRLQFFENMSSPPERILGKTCFPYVARLEVSDRSYFSTCQTIKLWLAEELSFNGAEEEGFHPLYQNPEGTIALKVECRTVTVTRDGLYFESSFNMQARAIIEKTER